MQFGHLNFCLPAASLGVCPSISKVPRDGGSIGHEDEMGALLTIKPIWMWMETPLVMKPSLSIRLPLMAFAGRLHTAS